MTESKQPNDSQNASSKSDSQELSEQMTPEAFDKRYWLNRWRKEQIEQGKTITYGD